MPRRNLVHPQSSLSPSDSSVEGIERPDPVANVLLRQESRSLGVSAAALQQYYENARRRDEARGVNRPRNTTQVFGNPSEISSAASNGRSTPERQGTNVESIPVEAGRARITVVSPLSATRRAASGTMYPAPPTNAVPFVQGGLLSMALNEPPPRLRNSYVGEARPLVEDPSPSLPTNVTPAHTETRPSYTPDIRKLAEDASILLELLSKTYFSDGRSSHQELFNHAMEKMLKIKNEYDGVNGQEPNTTKVQDPQPEDVGDTKVDSACIVCYDQLADIVLLPCNHLVLCSTCCNKMGITGKGPHGKVAVPCPICRVGVQNKIKIFRA